MGGPLRSFFTRSIAIMGLLLASPILAQADGLPPYARAEESLHGIVTSFDGHYHLEVRDDRGFLDDITLHQGTIINPLGLTLEQGMTVTVMGRPNNGTFLANEIDTPYHTVYPYPVVVPVPVYGYGDGYARYPHYRHYPSHTTVILHERHYGPPGNAAFGHTGIHGSGPRAGAPPSRHNDHRSAPRH